MKAGFASLIRKILNEFSSSSAASSSGFHFRIRELVLLQREDGAACSHIRDLLKAKIEIVHKKIAELAVLERQLTKRLRNCERTLRAVADVHKGYCPVLEEIAHQHSDEH